MAVYIDAFTIQCNLLSLLQAVVMQLDFQILANPLRPNNTSFICHWNISGKKLSSCWYARHLLPNVIRWLWPWLLMWNRKKSLQIMHDLSTIGQKRAISLNSLLLIVFKNKLYFILKFIWTFHFSFSQI